MDSTWLKNWFYILSEATLDEINLTLTMELMLPTISPVFESKFCGLNEWVVQIPTDKTTWESLKKVGYMIYPYPISKLSSSEDFEDVLIAPSRSSPIYGTRKRQIFKIINITYIDDNNNKTEKSLRIN